MAERILVMGLPGAGKTSLAREILKLLESANKTVTYINADKVRLLWNDWDFTPNGRIRQSQRMKSLSDLQTTDYVIGDFVAPLAESRTNFEAHWTIWVDTIDKSRYEDTNKIFRPPEKYDFRVPQQDCQTWASIICKTILKVT